MLVGTFWLVGIAAGRRFFERTLSDAEPDTDYIFMLSQ
jgi:hypothetical protein